MRNLVAALNDVEMSDATRTALKEFFESASTHLINHGDCKQQETMQDENQSAI